MKKICFILVCRDSCPLIIFYRKYLNFFLHGQRTSIKYSSGCKINPSKNDELIGLEILNTSVVSVNYLQTTQSFLASFRSFRIHKSWNRIKHISIYLKWTIEMRLLSSNGLKSQLVDYVDTKYLLHMHNGQLQMKNLFTYISIIISRRSTN